MANVKYVVVFSGKTKKGELCSIARAVRGNADSQWLDEKSIFKLDTVQPVGYTFEVSQAVVAAK